MNQLLGRGVHEASELSTDQSICLILLSENGVGVGNILEKLQTLLALEKADVAPNPHDLHLMRIDRATNYLEELIFHS